MSLSLIFEIVPEIQYFFCYVDYCKLYYVDKKIQLILKTFIRNMKKNYYMVDYCNYSDVHPLLLHYIEN